MRFSNINQRWSWSNQEHGHGHGHGHPRHDWKAETAVAVSEEFIGQLLVQPIT
jgi:hypothetical protein